MIFLSEDFLHSEALLVRISPGSVPTMFTMELSLLSLVSTTPSTESWRTPCAQLPITLQVLDLQDSCVFLLPCEPSTRVSLIHVKALPFLSFCPQILNSFFDSCAPAESLRTHGVVSPELQRILRPLGGFCLPSPSDGEYGFLLQSFYSSDLLVESSGYPVTQ